MNNETQTLLKELIEAVNSPDWWAIGITIVNALIMAWLAWRQYQLQKQQNKLQEQQIRQQEYEIYRELYKLVKNANHEIDDYLENIADSFGGVSFQRADGGFIKTKLAYISQLYEDLSHRFTDYEIKFSRDFFDYRGYSAIFGSMLYTLRLIDEMVDKGQVEYDSNGYDIVSVEGSMEKGYACYIAEHIKDARSRSIIGTNLLHFIKRKEMLRTNGNDILEKIRERCKVE